MFSGNQKREILNLLRNKKSKCVMVQVPEGLKSGSLELMKFLDGKGISAILSIEPCFGACDLRGNEAKELGCDTLLHIGHKDFGVEADVPVVYYEYRIRQDFVPFAKMAMKQLRFRNLCLVSTVQFIDNLEPVKKFLDKNGFRVFIGGEVLGCDASNAKKYDSMVDAFLFIGSGKFHPLGLQEKVGKPVFFLDIEKRTFEDLSGDKDKLHIKREMRIQKARGLSKFGIIVSTKPGQSHIKTAENLEEFLLKKGKFAFIMAVDQLAPEKLLGIDIDVIVNTACPRITEDNEQFKKVILNPEDALRL